MSAFAAWILTLMLALQPRAGVPWASTYEATAQAIADVVSTEAPLFDGEQGRAKTAALLVSLAFFESTFNAEAIGDHGAAKSLYQVHGPMPSDARAATREALAIMRQSFHACRSLPVAQRLAFYASGGADGCSNPAGQKASTHRMARARWLLVKIPPPN